MIFSAFNVEGIFMILKVANIQIHTLWNIQNLWHLAPMNILQNKKKQFHSKTLFLLILIPNVMPHYFSFFCAPFFRFFVFYFCFSLQMHFSCIIPICNWLLLVCIILCTFFFSSLNLCWSSGVFKKEHWRKIHIKQIYFKCFTSWELKVSLCLHEFSFQNQKKLSYFYFPLFFYKNTEKKNSRAVAIIHAFFSLLLCSFLYSLILWIFVFLTKSLIQFITKIQKKTISCVYLRVQYLL